MKIKNILSGDFNNHIFPFMWVHGESAQVYRETVQAIYHANIRAFCVEARPHEQFCRLRWWQDMEIILDEAEKLGMKVWILDDKHFPTGYANGAVEKAPAKLRRQSILAKEIELKDKVVSLDIQKECHRELSWLQKATDYHCGNNRARNTFQDDRIISVTAIQTDKNGKPVPLNKYISNGILKWKCPSGKWKIMICWLSRNAGTHRGYINMMDRESCRILIDQVYETHYEHFKEKFGTVIAGFFSDEPELGNGPIYKMYNTLGTEQDLPWSSELEKQLRKKLGKDYAVSLPLLWNNECDEKLTAKVRYIFMDEVTRLVEKSFSKQIGMWCREHGVEYIGHVVEDCNQHARTGTSLGHYFRGMKWQTMAGIDVIGGQIYPQGEDIERKSIWEQPGDSEFYHYCLSKLGSSLGELNPNMKDRTMCEIFGNYTWSEGVRLEKYLADHCMVRGINRFVPHAFSCKEYPDPDCPPHFYAHGNDPLYRHFGRLMGYINRVTSLLEGGKAENPAAILYHAEAEWSGRCMLMQKPARILQDNQINFHFVPCDIFEEPNFYRTELGKKLIVNGKQHDVLIIPYAQFIPKATAEGIARLMKAEFPVVFLEALPEGICQGGELPEELRTCPVIKLEELENYVKTFSIKTAEVLPANKYIRAMHYRGDEELLYLFNEEDVFYKGSVKVPWEGETYLYNAWENCLEETSIVEGRIVIDMRPSESCILIRKGLGSNWESYALRLQNRKVKYVETLENFKIGYCRSIDYPDFHIAGQVKQPENFALMKPDFSGFISYETTFELKEFSFAMLEITDAYEGVEVFVNGKSAGIEILPFFQFDITRFCHAGINELRIEVATTLERENKITEDTAPTGITGKIYLAYA